MARQEVAFLKECRKIKGFGSLRAGFIPDLSQKIKGLGL